MRIPYQPVRIIGAAVIVLGFAACTGVQNTISPFASTAVLASNTISGRGSMRYDGKNALIFVVNGSNNRIEVYDPNLNDPSPIATITEGVVTPSGDCLDKSGTLYVVNGVHNSIAEYQKGHSAPFQVITTGLGRPIACAIDGAGNLWVTNTSGPNVTEYPKGSTSPSTVITKGIMSPIGVAFDRKGDMFVSNRPGGSRNRVEVYPPGGTEPSMTITDGITEPAGIAVDAKGTLYVANLGYNTIPEYKAGQYTPYQTITNGADYPVAVTVNKKGTLFVSNFLSNNIVEYAPGSLNPSGYTISQSIDGPSGAAYSPPLLPKKPQNHAQPLANPRAGASRMAMSHSDLLYVTDNGSGYVYVYTYPQLKLVQQLKYGFPPSAAGDCVDDRGNVFITEYNGHDVLVYRHGASEPMALLRDPGYPIGCSIDPTTQRLAVANVGGRNNAPGNVAIWSDPITSTTSGPTFVYSNLQFTGPSWCAYDANGDLFVDGQDYSQRKVTLAELPKGATSFETISVDLYLGWPPGDVVWDGQYISISVGNAIYRLAFSGSTAYVVGSTLLPLNWTLQGYSIAGAGTRDTPQGKLIATAGENVGFFRYPSGKGPSKTASQNYPLAPVVSPALP